jgi:hypothetical protein
MPSTIVLKNSSTAGRIPSIDDLVSGEVAINYADGKLFFKNSDGTIEYFNARTDYGTVKSVDINPGGTGLTFTGGPITTTGAFIVGGTLGIFNGGTGANNENDARNNILPSQINNNGKFLTTDGNNNVTWASVTGNDVTQGLGFVPVNKTGDTMTGNLILNADPTVDLGAATKQYVDNVASGLNIHTACIVTTTSNLTSVYNNGTQGVGATLMGIGDFPDIDGITLAANDRILVKNQTDKKQNGIYVLTQISPNWVLTRTSDFDNSPTNEVMAGDATYVQSGTVNSGTQWVMTTAGTIQIGTSLIEFTQFGGPGTIKAGQGIDLSNNTVSNTGVLQLTGSSNINVSDSTGNITVSFTGLLAVENGGTNASTPDGALTNLLPNQTGQDGKVLTTVGGITSWVDVLKSLPIATSSILGGVKQGNNVTIGVDGTISVEAPFSKNYSELMGAPTNLSDFDNDTNYITSSSLVWGNITGTPTNVSYFTNDAGYSTLADLTWDNIANKPTFATVATSGSLNDLINVDLSTPPVDGQVLGYSSVTQKWSAVTPSSGSGTPGGTSGQLQYNNNGSFAGITGVTATTTNVSFDDTTNISIGGGTSGQVLSTDGEGNVSWVSITNQTGPLVFTSSGNYRTLTGYQENGTTSTVRVAEFFSNKLRLTLATFTPTMTATAAPVTVNWDDAVTAFTVTVNNPDDIPDQYISSVNSINATTGSISALNTFIAGSQSSTPNPTVDWTQTFTTDADSFIRSASTTITGGTVAATIQFNYYNGTSTSIYTGSTASLSVTWTTPQLLVTLNSLSSNNFLQTYDSVGYTVTVTGISIAANYVNSITATGGSLSNSTTSGTFTFSTPIHKNNTGLTRTVNATSTLTRPQNVTGTSYSVSLTTNTSNPTITFLYPSFWLFTDSTSAIPTVTDIVSDTSFTGTVTVLGNQIKIFAGNVVNNSSDPKGFWFAVRSTVSQPVSFKTGPTSSLTSDVNVTTGNTVNLQPTLPPSGYVAERYTLYGITLQPGTTYVSIS